MKKTYLDSGVLMALYRTPEKLAIKAEEILDDPSREFVSSPFLKLEILSKALYYKRQEEVEFYEVFFAACTEWANDLEKIIKSAQYLASKYGLAALDALHIASAISLNADEFITTEKQTKPFFRVTEVKVISLAE